MLEEVRCICFRPKTGRSLSGEELGVRTSLRVTGKCLHQARLFKTTFCLSVYQVLVHSAKKCAWHNFCPLQIKACLFQRFCVCFETFESSCIQPLCVCFDTLESSFTHPLEVLTQPTISHRLLIVSIVEDHLR